MTGFWEAMLEERIEREEAGKEALEASTSRFCEVSEACPFDCIAITAPNPRASQAYLDELVRRVGGKGEKEVLVLAVSDPEGVRIGSGGGTLNAVLEIDEALKAVKATEREDPQTGGLSTSRVLLVHSGGDSQRSPTQCVCGKAWSALNSCNQGGGHTICSTPMDLLLDHLSGLFGSGLSPGSLVVTACDVMLLIPPEVAATADWSTMDGSGAVAGLAIAADAAKYASNHGVYCLDGAGREDDVEGEKCGITGVAEYLQKPSFEGAEASRAFLGMSGKQDPNDQSQPNPEVAIDSGVVVFAGEATKALTRLAYSDALKGCTARGVSEGTKALRLELYSDLLLALRTGISSGAKGGLDAYLAACGPALAEEHPLTRARKEVWASLNAFPLGAVLLRGATFVHLGTTPELMEMMSFGLPEFIEPYGLTARAGSKVGAACSVAEAPPAVVVNSCLEGAGVVASGAVVEHCRLQGDGWEVGASSLLSGVRSLAADRRLCLRSGMCLQQTDLTDDGDAKTFVVSLFAAGDDIKARHDRAKATVCGTTWKAFMRAAGATAEDIWGGIAEEDRKLWSARLFPVLEQPQGGEMVGADIVMWMQDVQDLVEGDDSVRNDVAAEAAKEWLAAERLSFKEILARADPAAEFIWRRKLEEEMRKESGVSEDEGRRYRVWDAVALIVPDIASLRSAQHLACSLSGSRAVFCVPPPDPTASAHTNGDAMSGPLIMNALMFVAERFSALKRAQFGSETSAEALYGMNILFYMMEAGGNMSKDFECVVPLCVPELTEEGSSPPSGGIWVLPRSGRAFLIEDAAIALLLNLCQSDPLYQPLTYLGVDNAVPLPQDPAQGSTDAFSFVSLAAGTACPFDPEAVFLGTGEGRTVGCASEVGPEKGTLDAATGALALELEALDRRARDEACTPADAAQALARIACRMYDLADRLGGGGHRSGPGEHPAWQAAMSGLDTLQPLQSRLDWGPPASLSASVEALKHLREIWLGAGDAKVLRPDPHLVVRCARHYERAAAVVVSACVATASLFVEPPPASWLSDPATGGTALPSSSEGVLAGGKLAGDSIEETIERRSVLQPMAVCSPVAVGTSRPELCPAGATHKEQQQQQRQQQRSHLSPRLSQRERAMALHVEGHTDHLEVVRRNADVTEQRLHDGRCQSKQSESGQPEQPLPVGASAISSAPARIDFAGGWTDTPPISYEAGGAVVNAAVTVSGERPVEARCERIAEARVELVCEARGGHVSTNVVCTHVEDFTDVCVPQAPAALLKAAIIVAGVVTIPSASNGYSAPPTLRAQLARVFGEGGVRVTTRSLLPKGSGMGTSSILAGVILSAVCAAAGRAMSTESVIHAVLRVEQLMTAGGGHQDQVGGLLGGVKICRTAARLPLQVQSEAVILSPEFQAALNSRLVLVFSGKQRLARDLLQGVMRGWHDRLPGTVKTVKALTANAEEAAEAFGGTGNMAKLGLCLTAYWEQKKRMAPGAEPPEVKTLLDKIRPVCHGLSVCGAGGGGFVACLTKRPNEQGFQDVTNAVMPLCRSSMQDSTLSVHRGRLDPVGLQVRVDMPQR